MSINKRKITRNMLAMLVKADSEQQAIDPQTETLRSKVRARLSEDSHATLDRLRSECSKLASLRTKNNTKAFEETKKEIIRLHKIIKARYL